jgi:hypothetical protein
MEDSFMLRLLCFFFFFFFCLVWFFGSLMVGRIQRSSLVAIGFFFVRSLFLSLTIK